MPTLQVSIYHINQFTVDSRAMNNNWHQPNVAAPSWPFVTVAGGTVHHSVAAARGALPIRFARIRQVYPLLRRQPPFACPSYSLCSETFLPTYISSDSGCALYPRAAVRVADGPRGRPPRHTESKRPPRGTSALRTGNLAVSKSRPFGEGRGRH